MNKIANLLAGIGQGIGKPPGWERVVRIFASPGKCSQMVDVCVACDAGVFLAQPSVPLGWHVKFFGTYEPEVRRIFKAVLSEGDVAIDIGANVGWHTLLMSKAVGPTGRVVAVEANPSVRRRLLDNLAINRVDNTTVLPIALSDKDGVVSFFAPEAEDASSGDGHIGPGLSMESTITVEMQRLDTAIETLGVKRVDLIKIDVEGFEWPVLQGGKETIAKYRPSIVFEYIAEYATRGGGSPKLIWEYFERMQYRLFRVERNWATAFQLNDWPSSADILAVPFSVVSHENCNGN